MNLERSGLVESSVLTSQIKETGLNNAAQAATIQIRMISSRRCLLGSFNAPPLSFLAPIEIDYKRMEALQ